MLRKYNKRKEAGITLLESVVCRSGCDGLQKGRRQISRISKATG